MNFRWTTSKFYFAWAFFAIGATSQRWVFVMHERIESTWWNEEYSLPFVVFGLVATLLRRKR